MSGHIQEPFKAYEGDEPFIFVSYSQADKQEVFQDIDYLNRVKYRIWYDEGLRAYEDLYQRISAKIMSCSYLLAFLSPKALESTFVSREILLGFEKRKTILPVYLQELNLPAQLEFPLLASPGLKKYELSTDQYFRRLMRLIPDSVLGKRVSSLIEEPTKPDKGISVEVGPKIDSAKPAQAPAAHGSNDRDHYDAFISYRRESGAAEARLIQERLRQRSKRVFLDVDDLRPGHFDEELLKRIEEARNFIIILSPNCLTRCVDDRDWLRQEIVHALKTNRNVIPIMLPGFDFPNARLLPNELQTLATHHGVSYNHEYFDAMIDKIVRYLGPD